MINKLLNRIGYQLVKLDTSDLAGSVEADYDNLIDKLGIPKNLPLQQVNLKLQQNEEFYLTIKVDGEIRKFITKKFMAADLALAIIDIVRYNQIVCVIEFNAQYDELPTFDVKSECVKILYRRLLTCWSDRSGLKPECSHLNIYKALLGGLFFLQSHQASLR